MRTTARQFNESIGLALSSIYTRLRAGERDERARRAACAAERPALLMSSAAAAPTESQRRAADALRAEGNILFQKGRFAAAAERYTEAIVLHPSAPLFVNRALCARKQLAAAAAAAANGASGGADAAAAATALWRRVLSDARRALELDRANMKGLYLSGLALRELGGEGDGEGEGGGDGGRAPREAIALLARALEEARAKDDAIKDEIWCGRRWRRRRLSLDLLKAAACFVGSVAPFQITTSSTPPQIPCPPLHQAGARKGERRRVARRKRAARL